MEFKNVGSNYDGVRRRMDGILQRKIGIPKKVQEVISEVVVRRCEEFSLSAPELNRDIESLTTFLDSVEFGKMLKGYERAAGLFCSGDKKIILGQQYLGGLRRELFKDVDEHLSNWKAYETFTHELYHAMSKNPNGEDRMNHYSIYTGERMVNLLEMITEVSAIRSCGSVSEMDFLAGIRPCNGYSDLTFSLEAMAATFGMTEKEFLKAGMGGFSQLEQAIGESAGNKDVKAFFTNMDIIAEKMHSQLYPWGEEQRPTKEQLAENLTSDMKSFIDVSQEAIRYRLMTSDKPIEELSAEMLFNHNKLENNLIHGINGFKWRLSQEQADELYIHTKIQGLETKKLVRGLARVIENKESLGPVFYEQAINDIRSGRILMDYKAYADMYGLESEKELNNPPPRIPDSYMEKLRKDDFSDGKVWDNKEILDKIRGSVINNKFVHKVEDSMLHSGLAISNGVKRLLDSNRLMLAPAYQVTSPIKSINIEKTAELPAIEKTAELSVTEKTAKLSTLKTTEKTAPLETINDQNKTAPLKVVQESEKEPEPEPKLAFGELSPEQKKIAQKGYWAELAKQGYLDALNATYAKEGGMEERPNKDDKER